MSSQTSLVTVDRDKWLAMLVCAACMLLFGIFLYWQVTVLALGQAAYGELASVHLALKSRLADREKPFPLCMTITGAEGRIQKHSWRVDLQETGGVTIWKAHDPARVFCVRYEVDTPSAIINFNTHPRQVLLVWLPEVAGDWRQCRDVVVSRDGAFLTDGYQRDMISLGSAFCLHQNGDLRQLPRELASRETLETCLGPPASDSARDVAP